MSIGRLWSPAPLGVGRGHVPPPAQFDGACQSVHIISLPMRCPALVVVVVHLVGDPRMLGGHGVEPGAPLVERVVPLRLPLLAPRLLLPRAERRRGQLLLLLRLRLRTPCCHWPSCPLGGGKQTVAAPCAVVGWTNGDASESARRRIAPSPPPPPSQRVLPKTTAAAPASAPAAPCVSARSSLLVLPKATATRVSSTLHSWLKMMHCSSSLSAASAIAARGARSRVLCTVL